MLTSFKVVLQKGVIK